MMLKALERLLCWRLRRANYEERASYISSLLKRLCSKESTREALKFIFTLDNRLYRLESQFSTSHEKGVHPKHRITQYHDFFVSHLNPGDAVLDVGSGRGYLAYQMVSCVQNVRVTGIESNEKYVDQARKHYQHPNLKFLHQDAIKELPHGPFDVITLSNVIEHLPNRIDFLKKVISETHPKKLIIRVPQYDRDWRVALKDEIGVDSRLNRGHTIEYTKERLLSELKDAQIHISEIKFSWGEIWAVAEPQSQQVTASSHA